MFPMALRFEIQSFVGIVSLTYDKGGLASFTESLLRGRRTDRRQPRYQGLSSSRPFRARVGAGR